MISCHFKEKCRVFFLAVHWIYKKFLYYLSKNRNLKEAAKNLYSCLRKIKNKGYKSIAIQKIKNIGIGKTINDRLYRASNK